MNRALRIALIGLMGASLAGCAHAPRVINETDSVRQIRGQFLKANPNGPYNDHVARGEVVAGMGFIEVLASWGLPDSRWRSKAGELEYWSYFTRDADSGDWVGYTFTFEENAVSEWAMTRHVVKNGALFPWDLPQHAVTPQARRPLLGDGVTAVKR